MRAAFTPITIGTKGSRKNNFTFLAPMHSGWLRCESSEYARYSCVFAPCRLGASTLKICELIFGVFAYLRKPLHSVI